MKVSVTITVDLDPDAWRSTFGPGMTNVEVRQDVKAYIGNELTANGVFSNGEVPADITWR